MGGLFLLQGADAAGQIGKGCLLSSGVFLQGGDLFGVAPAEDIAAAVVDPIAVILLVSLSGGFDLSGPGDRPGLAAELFLICAAGQIETVGYLPFDPFIEGRIGLDLQLARD